MTGDTELDRFELGLAGPAQRPDRVIAVTGEQVTTLNSWWHTRHCERCGHTFRRGDRVSVGDDREVLHLDPLLRCAAGGELADTASDVLDFAEGVEAAWELRGDLPVRHTEDEPYLLAPPLGGFRRQQCLFCAHTFRPGELVIVCPCQGGQRQLCRRAVHRDPAQGLVCWESWRPDSSLRICPVTLTRVGD
jgi:hypothetical protein